VGLRHGHPVGTSASLRSSSRFKWCSQMRRSLSVCFPIRLVLLRRGCEALRSMLNRRQRREFEQKAAKETKVNQGLGLRHGHPVGPSASLQSSSRFKWCSQMRRSLSVRLQIGLVLLRRGCEALRSKLNKRQRREFEQKAAKETKVNQELGLRHSHLVGPSASLRSSSRFKW
jgi:hypothetical protein